MLAGAAAGLAAAPLLADASTAGARTALVGTALGGCALAAARPRAGRGVAWLVAVGALSLLAGLAGGALRVRAIDAGALEAPPGARIEVHGFVAEVPRRRDGEVRAIVDGGAGRVLVVAPDSGADLPVGAGVAATGVVREPDPWEAGYLERRGVRRVLTARAIEATGRHREGLAGVVDGIRAHAEAALGRGTPSAEAALLRGFVLGEDDRIGEATVAEFQRSGLAHLLAVSGQNVVLLALLAAPIMALLGVPLRIRLACLLALIALYVPVAGAGPSIQRAGVMGAAGVVAALAGRPASRWHAMLLAAAITLALNPRAAGDAGWQLSFAAVAGIALWAAPLRDLLAGAAPGPVRAAVAEGAAMTLAATLATAPLMAHDFDAVSLAAVPSNLVALPAVAPVMWLGMLSAAAGQVPGVPVEPLTALAGLLAAYISQVAHWFSQPGWAQVDVGLPATVELLAAYAALRGGVTIALAAGRRRRRARPRAAVAAIAAVTLAAIPLAALARSEARAGGVPPLRVTVLDVGEGDSILLEPADADPILVDGGPPGDGLAAHLRGLGITHLGAAIITHDQADHAGGISEVLGELPVDRLVYARCGPELLADARSTGAVPTRIAEGSELDSGSLRLEALWPPRALLGARGTDPNELALVLVARWHDFDMLLAADAEAEAVPLEPGPLDVLKVAHHGSEDAGLDRLLDRTAPRLAVISVGAGNPYGHPAPPTLADLADHGMEVMRTDRDGDVTIDVARGGWVAQ